MTLRMPLRDRITEALLDVRWYLREYWGAAVVVVLLSIPLASVALPPPRAFEAKAFLETALAVDGRVEYVFDHVDPEKPGHLIGFYYVWPVYGMPGCACDGGGRGSIALRKGLAMYHYRPCALAVSR